MFKRAFSFLYGFSYFKTYRKFVKAQNRLWISKILVLILIPFMIGEYVFTKKVFFFVILEVSLILYNLVKEMRVASKGRVIKDTSQIFPKRLGLKVIRLYPGSYKLKSGKNKYSLEVVVVERYNKEDLLWQQKIKPIFKNKITRSKKKDTDNNNKNGNEVKESESAIIGGYITPAVYDESYKKAIIDDVIKVLETFENADLESNEVVIYGTFPIEILFGMREAGVEVLSMSEKMVRKHRVKPSIKDWQKDFSNGEESYPQEWITIELNGIKNNDSNTNESGESKERNIDDKQDDVLKRSNQ